MVIALAIALPRMFPEAAEEGGGFEKAFGMLRAFGVLAAMLPLATPSVGLPLRPSWRAIAWAVAWRVAIVTAIIL